VFGRNGEQPSDQYNDDPKVLNIVMGSEQHLVFEQIVRPWCEKNGLSCTPKELGSGSDAAVGAGADQQQRSGNIELGYDACPVGAGDRRVR
jgi:hypothetical protein